MLFKIIKKFYKMGLYTAKDVVWFVKDGSITAEQYKQITGIDYIEE